jgi:hypothetical protein
VVRIRPDEYFVPEQQVQSLQERWTSRLPGVFLF